MNGICITKCLKKGKKKIIMTASDYVNSGVILTGGDSERNHFPIPSHAISKAKNVAAAAAIAASGHKMLSSTVAVTGYACIFSICKSESVSHMNALLDFFFRHKTTPKWTYKFQIKCCSIFCHKVDNKRDIRP